MKVRVLLELLGDNSLAKYKPEGSLVLDAIHRYIPDRYDIATLTGNTALELIQTKLQDNERDAVLDTELNDGVDYFAMRAELQNIADGSYKGNVSRRIITISMTVLVCLCTLSYLVSMLWVSYHQKTLPTWQELALPFGVPGMVIWKYFGIINKERSDMLMAAIGRAPTVPTTIIGEVTKRIRND